MKVKLDSGAYMPERAHDTDAGLDLRCREGKIIWPKCYGTFDTGVHLELPEKTYGKVESKSGLNVKHNIVSCGGIIKEDGVWRTQLLRQMENDQEKSWQIAAQGGKHGIYGLFSQEGQ